jgi:lipopolysaccharide transport system ATP-binding protein
MGKDAIVVSNLHKVFRIPHEKKNTFFEHLTGFYKKNGHEEFVALKNINFSVKKGEAIGIIGENGSGKSTLLKIIANILRPDSGSIKINGKITPFLELGVGFQPDLTAKENIYLYGAVMEMSDKEIDSKIEEILNFSELKNFEDTKLKNFSSGMQVRLAFATAIQTNPDILILDEVLAVGDMGFQQKCLNIFEQYIKEKKTIVFVSHDLGSIRRFCNKTLLLRHGEQAAFGNSGEIIDKYVYGIYDKKKESQRIEVNTEKKPRVDKLATITDVKFFDKFEKENIKFISGDQMKIRIYYSTSNIIKRPTFGIAIYSENDILCYGTNTELKGISIDNIEGDGYIDINVDKLPMIQGKFLLTAAINSGNIHHDWIDKKFNFEVLKVSSRSVGLFEIPCSFEFNDNLFERVQTEDVAT